MAIQVFHIVRPTIALHVRTAGIDSPGHISDLAANEGFIPRLAESDRDIGFPFRQVEKAFGDYQLDPQSRIASVKGIDERRLPEASRPARSAGHANDASQTFVTRGEVTLECRDRRFHALGGGSQLFSKGSQSIAGKVA